MLKRKSNAVVDQPANMTVNAFTIPPYISLLNYAETLANLSKFRPSGLERFLAEIAPVKTTENLELLISL
jgi:hypothetical protein